MRTFSEYVAEKRMLMEQPMLNPTITKSASNIDEYSSGLWGNTTKHLDVVLSGIK